MAFESYRFSDRFPEPASIAEAEARRAELQQSITEIQGRLDRPQRADEEYAAWRTRAETALRIKQAQAAKLEEWIEKRLRCGGTRTAIEVLADVSDLVKSLELYDLTPAESGLVREMERIVGNYREVRTGSQATPEMSLRLGDATASVPLRA